VSLIIAAGDVDVERHFNLQFILRGCCSSCFCFADNKI